MSALERQQAERMQAEVKKMQAEVDSAADELARHLNGPVLTMYYPDDASIEAEDVGVLYQQLRQQGLAPARPLSALNVVLHTTGGDANASYRLAQLLRDFAGKVTFIVPEQAYSGGTTIILAGDRVVLAHCAVLSPIDVGLYYGGTEADTGEERLEPVAMDHYIAMASDAKVKIESALQEQGISDAGSAVDEALMTAMVDNPENAMRIGTYYRQRNIAETYARHLLENYMLKNSDPVQVQKVIDGLITQAPDHEFDLDYHLCSDIGLVVSEADQKLSDLSKKLVRVLERATEANIICERKFNNLQERNPFFHYIPHSNPQAQHDGGADQDGHEQPQ